MEWKWKWNYLKYTTISWASRVSNEACGFVAVDKGLQLAIREFKSQRNMQSPKIHGIIKFLIFFLFLIKLQSIATEAEPNNFETCINYADRQTESGASCT